MKLSTLFSVLCLLSAVGVFTWVAARATERPVRSSSSGTSSSEDRGSMLSAGDTGASEEDFSSASSSSSGLDGDQSATAATASWSPTGDGLEEDLTPHGVDYAAIAAQLAMEDDETPHVAVLATTLDLWSCEPFRKLTLADVRKLLPDAAVDLSGDGLFLERIGGLPTEEDALHALDYPEVQDALYKFLVADGVAGEFAMNPNTTPEFERLLDNAERARDAAQDALYRALDEKSGYGHWGLLGALWRAFDAD